MSDLEYQEMRSSESVCELCFLVKPLTGVCGCRE